MRLVVYLPLVVPLLAALAARPLAERLPPVAATWLLSVSALLLAAASSAVLGMLALTTVVRVPLVDVLGKMSGQVIRADDPASVPIALAAGALLAAAAASTARALWRRVLALLAAGCQARRLPGSGQVVVTADDTADAYTLPGLPCRVVITAGMLRALSHPEQQVLLAHERAHAAGLHYLFGTAARVAAAACPLLHPVTAAVGYAMERWPTSTPLPPPETGSSPPEPSRAPPSRPPQARPAALRATASSASSARSPASPGPGAQGRCHAALPPCSARRRSPACCSWPPGSCSSPCPAPRSWRQPATCTPSWPSPATTPGPDRPPASRQLRVRRVGIRPAPRGTGQPARRPHSDRRQLGSHTRRDWTTCIAERVSNPA